MDSHGRHLTDKDFQPRMIEYGERTRMTTHDKCSSAPREVHFTLEQLVEWRRYFLKI